MVKVVNVNFLVHNIIFYVVCSNTWVCCNTIANGKTSDRPSKFYTQAEPNFIVIQVI